MGKMKLKKSHDSSPYDWEEDLQTKAVAQTMSYLIRNRFKDHKVARVSLWVLIVFYFVGVLLPGFFAPYAKFQEFPETFVPPNSFHVFDEQGKFHLVPFVYGFTQTIDPETYQLTITVNTEEKYPLRLFPQGTEYRLFGRIRTKRHLFGTAEGGRIHFWGTDNIGRDVFSRTIYAMQPSLTIGLAGVAISLVLGLLIGGISGLAGGGVDMVIQRIIEALMSIPHIPVWMGLAAAVPKSWSSLQVYFAITIILSFFGWTEIARVVRSKFLSLREEDYVNAARSFNATNMVVIFQHLIPNFMSYVIVSLTMSIPGMILGETSLSFLGIGLRPPVVSLGVLLSQAQSLQVVALYPWLMLPGIVVVIIVLAFNFVGDGLRDAVDPYK